LAFFSFPIPLNACLPRRRRHAVVIITVGAGGSGVGRIDKRMDGETGRKKMNLSLEYFRKNTLFFLEKMYYFT
jgi:hypothetical protein